MYKSDSLKKSNIDEIHQLYDKSKKLNIFYK